MRRRIRYERAFARLVVMPAVVGSTAFPAAAASADGPVMKPRLSVAKAASVRRAVAGHAFTYTITVRNVGKVPARRVRLMDRMPHGVLVLRVRSGACRTHHGRVSCVWPKVAYHRSVRVVVEARVVRALRARTRLVNTARVTYAGRRTAAAATVVALPPPRRRSAYSHHSARPERADHSRARARSTPAPVPPRPERPAQHYGCARGDAGGAQSPDCGHRKHPSGLLPHTGGPIAWLVGLALLSLAVGVLAITGRLRHLRRR